MQNDRKIVIQRIAVLAIVLSTVITVAALAWYYIFGNALEHPKYLARADRLFSDFSQVLQFSVSDNPFAEHHTSYPPLAIIIFRPWAKLCSAEHMGGNADFFNSPIYVAIYLAYFICSLSLVYIILGKLTKPAKDPELAIRLFAIFAFSACTFYAFVRGNIIFLPLVFTLLFLVLKDSENRLFRELALVSLALAGAIKIYPLIFGVFLLKDKKMFASVRVAIYFFIMFFLPFLFFDGGFENIGVFLENLTRFQYGENRNIQLANLSVSGLIEKIFGKLPTSEVTLALSGILTKFCTVLILLLCIFVALVTKNDFRRAFAAVAAICAVPSVSYAYVLIFMLIPLTFYALDPTVPNCKMLQTSREGILGKVCGIIRDGALFWTVVVLMGLAFVVHLRFFILHAIFISFAVICMAVFEIWVLMVSIRNRKLLQKQ